VKGCKRCHGNTAADAEAAADDGDMMAMMMMMKINESTNIT